LLNCDVLRLPLVLNSRYFGRDLQHFAMHRHAKGINLTFFDGSTHHVRAKKIWMLQWHKNYDLDAAAKQAFPVWMN